MVLARDEISNVRHWGVFGEGWTHVLGLSLAWMDSLERAVRCAFAYPIPDLHAKTNGKPSGEGKINSFLFPPTVSPAAGVRFELFFFSVLSLPFLVSGDVYARGLFRGCNYRHRGALLCCGLRAAASRFIHCVHCIASSSSFFDGLLPRLSESSKIVEEEGTSRHTLGAARARWS